MTTSHIRRTHRSGLRTLAARLCTSAISLTTAAAMLGGCEVPDHERPATDPIDSMHQELFVLSTTTWASSKIPVCWENPGAATATQRGWVRSAVRSTWETASHVRFTEWDTCAPGDPGIHIRIADTGPHVKALGDALDGYTGGMVLNFTFANWSPSCQNARQACVEDIAVHEFGHALGFAHEQNRPDTPGWCDERQGTNGDTLVGGWDLRSVMNYCNPEWNGDGTLSAGDIAGVRHFYGGLGAGIVNYVSGGYEEFSYRLEDNVVTVGGLVKLASGNPADWTTNRVIATLPRDMRPSRRLIFSLDQHGKTARVDVHANGDITYVNGDPEYAWVSLSGISFAVDADAPLARGPGVVDYGSGYADAAYTLQDGIVLVEGLVRIADPWTGGRLIGTLPAGRRPTQRLIFNLDQHGVVARVDVLPDGRILYITGDPGRPWVSLSGIQFALAPEGAVPLSAGIVNYGRGYAGATYTRRGGVVTVSGLVERAAGVTDLAGTILGRLPVGARPSKRRIFALNQHADSARVDVLPDGHIVYVTGPERSVYVSLSGIEFELD